MPISRRDFFRGLKGKSAPEPEQKVDRAEVIDTYVRTNLLPYDFALTEPQILSVLQFVRKEQEASGASGDPLSPDNRTRLRALADEAIQPLREQFMKAEENRQNARVFVREFLATEATPDDLQKIRDRFHIPYLTILEDEIERQVTAWVYGLSNEHLADMDGPALRELVFSELRSWC